MKFQIKTENNYDFGSVISALQKEIRRGKEVEAMYWCLELYRRYHNSLCTRLRVIAQEDIGLGDPMALIFVNAQADHFYALEKEGSRRLVVANTVLYLCRARKSREADHFQCVVNQRREQQGWRIEIPDYAKDKHTAEGKAMGRGWDHWFTEGCYLDDLSHPSSYQAEAEKLWPTMQRGKSPKIKDASPKESDLDLFGEN